MQQWCFLFQSIIPNIQVCKSRNTSLDLIYLSLSHFYWDFVTLTGHREAELKSLLIQMCYRSPQNSSLLKRKECYHCSLSSPSSWSFPVEMNLGFGVSTNLPEKPTPAGLKGLAHLLCQWCQLLCSETQRWTQDWEGDQCWFVSFLRPHLPQWRLCHMAISWLSLSSLNSSLGLTLH